MSAQLFASGWLGADPREIMTRSGKLMAIGSLAASIDSAARDTDADGDPLWLGIVAFGKMAERLLIHTKSDFIAVGGKLQRSRWTAQDGAEREQLQIVAADIASAKTARGARRPASRSNGRRERQPAGAAAGGFDEEGLPF